MGFFRINGKDGVRDSHIFTVKYHREEGVVEPRQDVGGANSKVSSGGSMDAVRDLIHCT